MGPKKGRSNRTDASAQKRGEDGVNKDEISLESVLGKIFAPHAIPNALTSSAALNASVLPHFLRSYEAILQGKADLREILRNCGGQEVATPKIGRKKGFLSSAPAILSKLTELTGNVGPARLEFPDSEDELTDTVSATTVSSAQRRLLTKPIESEIDQMSQSMAELSCDSDNEDGVTKTIMFNNAELRPQSHNSDRVPDEPMSASDNDSADEFEPPVRVQPPRSARSQKKTKTLMTPVRTQSTRSANAGATPSREAAREMNKARTAATKKLEEQKQCAANQNRAEAIREKAERAKRMREEREAAARMKRMDMERERMEKLREKEMREAAAKRLREADRDAMSAMRGGGYGSHRSSPARKSPARQKSPAREKAKSPSRATAAKESSNTGVAKFLEFTNSPLETTPRVPVKKALLHKGAAHITANSGGKYVSPKRKSRRDLYADAKAKEESHSREAPLSVPQIKSEPCDEPDDLQSEPTAVLSVQHASTVQLSGSTDDYDSSRVSGYRDVKQEVRSLDNQQLQSLPIEDQENRFDDVSNVVTHEQPPAPASQPLRQTPLAAVNNKDSYDMTADKIFVAASKENYGIDDLSSGDETDDDEQPRKEIPEWAKGGALLRTVRSQARTPYDYTSYFGPADDVNLDLIFGNKKRFKPRTSSAVWDSPISRPRAGHSTLNVSRNLFK